MRRARDRGLYEIRGDSLVRRMHTNHKAAILAHESVSSINRRRTRRTGSRMTYETGSAMMEAKDKESHNGRGEGQRGIPTPLKEGKSKEIQRSKTSCTSLSQKSSEREPEDG